MSRIVIANGPGKLNDGREVILFPSRWDSAVPYARSAFYPYELAYLSTLLKRELPGDDVVMIDGNLRKWRPSEYASRLREAKPDVLVTECSALTYETMTRIMREVGAPWNILCGPMANYDRQRIEADGWTEAIAGEYEAQVLARLRGDSPDPTGYIDLDWLPWPEDEDVSRFLYREENHHAPGIVQLYPTRGCPLSCVFCVVPTYYGGHGNSKRSHRTRDVEDVCDEIEYLATKYRGFGGCYFNDEAHSANLDWLASFAEALIRRGLNRYHYDAMCGAWGFTEDLVALLARAGYGQIRFGVESTDPGVGYAIGKRTTYTRANNLLQWLKKYDMKAYITLQVGALGSTEKGDRATIEDAHDWIDQGLVQRWQLSTSTPQPGTPFWNTCKENGWLVTDDLNRYDGITACVSYPKYPADRIQVVRNEARL